MPLKCRAFLLFLVILLVHADADAAVTRFEVASRTVVANGQWFGAAGPYEKITGTVHFELDPNDARNRAITDLALAPRNARGGVEFTADLFILSPQDPARASGSVLFEISNRGGKGLLTTFNRATAAADPMQPEHFGDGLLMRNGFTLVWVGWEFDVAGLKITPPTAGSADQPLIEKITTSVVIDVRSVETAFPDAPFYAPFDMHDETASLTVRDRVWDMPIVIPRRLWQFLPPDNGGGGRCGGTARCPRVMMDSGFTPGRIYELTYRTANPPVSGVGLAAIRDVAAAVKNGEASAPVRGRYLHVFGSSQSGRFLRQFLYDGFNVDERGRRVFDGMMPHIAGAARGDFNQRFSQAVGLDQFTALKFPFTDAPQTDPASGKSDALLGRYEGSELAPKIIYTNSSVEYWGTGRAAALVHTSIDGKSDLDLPPNVRVYHVAGSQHGPGAMPPRAGAGAQLPNPTPHTIALRAFVLALDRWVRDGVEPPPSRYPKLSDGTLTAVSALKWPALPGVLAPALVPAPRGLPFLVPQVDEDGNELAGIRLPDQAVPIGTLTGWNFRNESIGNARAIVPLLGSLIPFAKTSAERGADPRKPLEDRYRSKADYLGRVTEVGLDLIKKGYVLREDLPFLLERATAGYEWATRPQSTQN